MTGQLLLQVEVASLRRAVDDLLRRSGLTAEERAEAYRRPLPASVPGSAAWVDHQARVYLALEHARWVKEGSVTLDYPRPVTVAPRPVTLPPASACLRPVVDRDPPPGSTCWPARAEAKSR